MKLASLRRGGRDGTLVVVRSDNRVFAPADGVAPTLQAALEDWAAVAPGLAELSAALAAGAPAGQALDPRALAAPLPRAYEWIDGSAYLNHVVLARKARGAEPPDTLATDPLVYQGGSGVLLGATDDIPLGDPAWGLDFEAEVCAILGDVRRGTPAGTAPPPRLLMLANDLTYRNLVAPELGKGFGFFVSKPATAFSPFAVTPDELGGAFRDGRAHLRLRSCLNEVVVGELDTGPEMHFSFAQLVAHATRTRALTAGTLVGSGTVSNEDRTRGVSCLVERRTLETLEGGAPRTPYLQPGDTIRIEAFDAAGWSVFGAIEQHVEREG
jgi:fumarylacetoacetate (FAA) hydrolase